MEKMFSRTIGKNVTIDCTQPLGAFEGWRHTIGHGGINYFPLPPKVQRGLAELKPRLFRTFIQEYFNVYPEQGVYDWSKLDPYMDSLAATGAKVVACICIKPPVLYPVLDQYVIMPNDVQQWQRLIEAMVHRYSVQKQIVTYWEIANESDIGENGGCPYYTLTPEDYNPYFQITAEAVLRAFPGAKIGGPALANGYSPLLEGLLKHCKETGMRLDFVSWHKYAEEPEEHVRNIRFVKELLARFYPDNRPEMLITEMCKGFEHVHCVQESAFASYRSADVASILLAMIDEGVDWTFYYHVWDQVFINDPFRPFFEDVSIMQIHWNEVPHRFGLYGVCCEVRPVYYVYRMLSQMNGDTLSTVSASGDLKAKSVRGDGRISTMLVNFHPDRPMDMVSELKWLSPGKGLKMLKVYRIDGDTAAQCATMDALLTERRFVDVVEDFRCDVYCPADSVTFVTLEDVTEQDIEAFYASIE